MVIIYGLDCARPCELIILENELRSGFFGIRDARNAKLELMNELESVLAITLTRSSTI